MTATTATRPALACAHDNHPRSPVPGDCLCACTECTERREIDDWADAAYRAQTEYYVTRYMDGGMTREAATARVQADEDAEAAYWDAQAARGELAGAPETMPCYACGGFNGVDAPERTVVALGPVAEAHRDPTTTYRLECGHLAI